MLTSANFLLTSIRHCERKKYITTTLIHILGTPTDGMARTIPTESPHPQTTTSEHMDKKAQQVVGSTKPRFMVATKLTNL